MSASAPAALRILQSVATLAGARNSLEAINTNLVSDRAIVAVVATDTLYMLRKNSSAAPSSPTIIAPAQGGPGRWYEYSPGGGSAFQPPLDMGNLGATPALDFATNPYIRGVLSVNAIPTMTLPAGYECFLELQQPAAGGPFVVSAWPAIVDWTDGSEPTLSTVNNNIDLIRFLSNGTRLRGWAQGMAYAP
jgi:hypothetical protein